MGYFPGSLRYGCLYFVRASSDGGGEASQDPARVVFGGEVS